MSQASAITSALKFSRDEGYVLSAQDRGFFRTRDAIIEALNAEPEPREIRELRFKLKSAYKEVGKAASRIYDLRTRLVESQQINKVDPTGYRGLLADNRELVAEVKRQREIIRELEQTAGETANRAEYLQEQIDA